MARAQPGGPLEQAAAEAVRHYLDALRSGDELRTRHPSRGATARRLAEIERELPQAPPMRQLRLLQEREDLLRAEQGIRPGGRVRRGRPHLQPSARHLLSRPGGRWACRPPSCVEPASAPAAPPESGRDSFLGGIRPGFRDDLRPDTVGAVSDDGEYASLAMYPFDALRPAWERLWAAVADRVPWAPRSLRWSGDVQEHWTDPSCTVAHACGWPIAAHLARPGRRRRLRPAAARRRRSPLPQRARVPRRRPPARRQQRRQPQRLDQRPGDASTSISTT